MVEQGSHDDDAMIANNDDIPTKLVISYDKDHPQNGSLYDVPINGRVQVGSVDKVNNVAKVFNNWIRDIKDLPVAELTDKVNIATYLFPRCVFF